jgi:hypothetical protein
LRPIVNLVILPELLERCFQLRHFDRLEQVINGIDFKCLQGMLVVGRCKNDRARYIGVFE